jgi:hypothetical protein
MFARALEKAVSLVEKTFLPEVMVLMANLEGSWPFADLVCLEPGSQIKRCAGQFLIWLIP